MTLDEREHVAEVARANWPGRQFINVSSCNVQDSLRLLNHCQQTKEHLKVKNSCKGSQNISKALSQTCLLSDWQYSDIWQAESCHTLLSLCQQVYKASPGCDR